MKWTTALILVLVPIAALCGEWIDLNVTYIERVPHTKSLHGKLKYHVRHLPSLTDEAREQVRKLEVKVRELERLLGKKTMEVEILREALERSQAKKLTLQLMSPAQDGSR